VGTNFLEVVAPVQENTAAGRYLAKRGGDGGYMVICQCDSHQTQLARKARAGELGIRIAWEREADEFHIMQLHPADTGGAFFEIDWDAKGEPEGNWWPAGGSDWPRAQRTDVVERFTAVELQSPDPLALAERWSSIAEIGLHRDPQGRTTLLLDNASLRFVEETDGRGEGLGGIDVRVADRSGLLQVAAERGCKVAEDQVGVCGTRFYLV
jgi:hypothetical protein